MSEFRLDIDVGGTHTDLVLLDPAGGILIDKAESTPVNPAPTVLDGMVRLCRRDIEPGEIDFFDHGTTVPTRALLEMKGARLGDANHRRLPLDPSVPETGPRDQPI